MKIINLKTKVIGPILLLTPMMCMYLGDGHHSRGNHSSIHQQSSHNFIHDNDTSIEDVDPVMTRLGGRIGK